ncbi:hypothetical protein V3C99_013449 [Haemonchus contortus]
MPSVATDEGPSASRNSFPTGSNHVKFLYLEHIPKDMKIKSTANTDDGLSRISFLFVMSKVYER